MTNAATVKRWCRSARSFGEEAGEAELLPHAVRTLLPSTACSIGEACRPSAFIVASGVERGNCGRTRAARWQRMRVARAVSISADACRSRRGSPARGAFARFNAGRRCGGRPLHDVLAPDLEAATRRVDHELRARPRPASGRALYQRPADHGHALHTATTRRESGRGGISTGASNHVVERKRKQPGVPIDARPRFITIPVPDTLPATS